MPLAPPPPFGTPMLPADSFAGKTVLITGGGTGVGLAMALELSRAGAAIGILSRNEEHRRRGVEAIEASGGKAAHAFGELREPATITAAFDEIEQQLGPVSILINNAAANFPVLASNTSANAMHAVVSIVLEGSFSCARELHARVSSRGADGVILNILATQAFTGGPGMAHASAAKAGLENLTKSLAVEWAPEGIRVVGLAPGLFHHDDMREDLKALRKTGADVDARRQPAMRSGQIHELAYAATWLCSPYASFITGHTLIVDGANHLRRNFVMPEFVPIAEQLSEVLRDKPEKPTD